ncbi:MAG: hypothetical protein Q7T49_02200 [bacterium]|nr:hypothetical protein [bacterium]
MPILQHIWSKCKTEWFTGLVLILVAVAAFGLGRLSTLKPVKTPIELIQAPAAVPNNNLDNNKNLSSSQVVGSKEGSKYHYPWCGGAKQIKPDNLVTFESPAAARTAGYTPAGNCPDLD